MADGMVPTNGPYSLPPRVRAQAIRAMDEPHGTTMRAEPETIEAAKLVLPRWRSLMGPASPEVRIAILFSLADVVGKPDVLRNGSQASQTQFWRIYHELLGHLPPEVLRRATMAFMAAPTKGAKWFPDPGTLLEFARKDEAYIADMKALYGLDRLTKAKPHTPGPLMTDEQWDELNAKKLAAIRQRVKDEAADQLSRDREALDALKAKAPPEEPFDHSRLLHRGGKAA